MIMITITITITRHVVARATVRIPPRFLRRDFSRGVAIVLITLASFVFGLILDLLHTFLLVFFPILLLFSFPFASVFVGVVLS